MLMSHSQPLHCSTDSWGINQPIRCSSLCCNSLRYILLLAWDKIPHTPIAGVKDYFAGATCRLHLYTEHALTSTLSAATSKKCCHTILYHRWLEYAHGIIKPSLSAQLPWNIWTRYVDESHDIECFSLAISSFRFSVLTSDSKHGVQILASFVYSSSWDTIESLPHVKETEYTWVSHPIIHKCVPGRKPHCWNKMG